MQPMSIEEQARRELLDYWEVWVDCGIRVFLACETTSEQKAWEQFSIWQHAAISFAYPCDKETLHCLLLWSKLQR
jgi:hypothetical protein